MRYYQISYPRSGANFLRHISRELLGLKALTEEEYTEGDKDDGVYIKRHRIKQPLPDAGLVVILRNYKECIVRHKKFRYPLIWINTNSILTFLRWSLSNFVKDFKRFLGNYKESSALEVLQKELDDYIHPILIFENWPGRKMLVYYEQLVLDEENVINNLAKFFGSRADRIKNLKSNINQLNQKSLIFYNKFTDQTFTKGKNIRFHQFNLTPEERFQWDDYIRKSYPELFEKYLTSYIDQ